MNRTLYTLLLSLLIPVFVLRLFWRSRKNPDYRARLGERLARASCWPASPPQGKLVHVHAVSVGEVHAAEPLIRKILADWNDVSVLVTTTTPTGSERTVKLFGENVLHVYLPYDLPGMMSCFLDHFSPAMTVIMETELWPNLLDQANRRRIKTALVNARLSEKSARGYRRLGGLAREMLGNLDLVCAQSQADATRFTALGLEPVRVIQVPSLKYDIEIPRAQVDAGHSLRRELFSERPVVIAASTRLGEDEQVLDAFQALRAAVPNAALVLVPRHTERTAGVVVLAQTRNFSVARRSGYTPGEKDLAVLVGDTMGEMFMYFALADVAFVGGSLVNTGCQNILEPAAMNLPVITGPSLFNFSHVSDDLRERGGQRVVRDSNELAQAWQALLVDDAVRQETGRKARQSFDHFGGGSGQTVAALRRLLE